MLRGVHGMADRRSPQHPRNLAFKAAIEQCRDMRIELVAERLDLELITASGWASGACPKCGSAGHTPGSGPVDRFNINLSDGGFFCRKGCDDAKGSGAIDLVMVVQGVSFKEAVRYLVGDVSYTVTEAELERQRAARKRRNDQAERNKANRRQEAIELARGQWMRARGEDRAPLRDYLALRGISRRALRDLPVVLRYLPDYPYELRRKIDGRWRTLELHRGPVMLAAIQGDDGKFRCLHQTWFDLSRPKGKPEILLDGVRQTNKLTRGSQRRGAIRLITPPKFTTLVMGEGIETTLTAAIAGREIFGPDTAYWAGISLGHMHGKFARVDGKRQLGQPDLEDERAFVPPEGVRRFIFIMDADGKIEETRTKLEAGLRRAKAQCSTCQRFQIVEPAKGQDLNDMLMGATK